MRMIAALAAVLGLVLTVAASSGFAQDEEDSDGARMGRMDPGMMMQEGSGPGPGMGRGMMGHDPEAMVAARLAYVKTALGITDDQMPAWTKYEEAARANMESMQAAHESMRKAMREGSAMERLQARIAMMENRLNAMKDSLPATEELYNVLTPEQQKKADPLLGMSPGVHMGGMGMGMGPM